MQEIALFSYLPSPSHTLAIINHSLSRPLFSSQGPVTFILRHIYAIWVKEQSEKSFPLSVLINSPET